MGGDLFAPRSGRLRLGHEAAGSVFPGSGCTVLTARACVPWSEETPVSEAAPISVAGLWD
ncbi:hypothetical protein J7E95_38290 [Streptomyces sp. ISL-14]|nr:hypothetical protein [Streptomyces sp. ISL-14]